MRAMSKLSWLALIGLVVVASGCNEQKPNGLLNIISTLQVTMVSPSPSALGTPTDPIALDQAVINVAALDANGSPFPATTDIGVFISFGGLKTGAAGSCGADTSGNFPLSTIHLTGGIATNQTIPMGGAFGATTIWLQEATSSATGASPTIYFRNPLISDVQTPPDLTAQNATFCSTFNNKYIVIDHATGNGQLVVSSVFGDSFAITDTGATTFNSMLIYTYSNPGLGIVPGTDITSFSGDVNKFVGFTELNFPLYNNDNNAPLAPVPSPIPLTAAQVSSGDIPGLLGADASTVVSTGTICQPYPPNPTNDPDIAETDKSWVSYNQFVLDGGGGAPCDSFSNFAVELPTKTFGAFDPIASTGKTATVVGMLVNNSGQNPELDGNGMTIPCSATNVCLAGTCVSGICKKGAYNFWTIQPRTPADITVQ